jgi:hypothetical protein
VPSAKSADPQAKAELINAERQLAERELNVAVLAEGIETGTSEAQALKDRLGAIGDDLRKYKDVRRLRKLGSADEPEVIRGVCPTCHQELSDALFEASIKIKPMSLEQNVSFYEEQVELFSAVLSNLEKKVEGTELQLQSERTEIEGLRSRIRVLRETLVSPSDIPSLEAVTERVRLETRIESLGNLLELFQDSLAEFAQLANEWRDVQERRAKLPKGALSEGDLKKISLLESSFRHQLGLYKMGSVDPSTLSISRGDYEPEVAGLNLGADVSGSDLIRLQWAYLLGLLQVGASAPTNHLGLLIMDEPQQQSVEEGSFQAMLEFASKFSSKQVIVATSHERRSLGLFLTKIGVSNLYEYEDSRVLGRL